MLLGTFLNSRGAVVAIASAVAFAGSFTGSVLPQAAEMTPLGLPHLALALAIRQPLPDYWGLALMSTMILTLACVAATLWRIG